jgi:NAD(P)-dependent dehydrogenase (short-subunit alcohol dehydrogenase family)
MSSQRGSIAGRVVAITGAARGIGLATARAMHAAGAKVAIGDIDREAAAGAAAGIGSDVHGAGLDVSHEASFAEFLAGAERALGPLEILVNNAGIMPIGPLLEESEATARRVMEVNVLGVMNGMRLALPGMLARGAGHVVNVSSVAGRSPVPGGLSYAASKAAVFSATETARVEFAGRGVAFTCVMPSFTSTELIAGTKGTRFIASVSPEKVAEAILAGVRAQRADVFVPGAVGAILKLQSLTGRRLRDTVNHLIGADRTFLDFDRAARGAYERRVAQVVQADDPEAPGPAEDPAAR